MTEHPCRRALGSALTERGGQLRTVARLSGVLAPTRPAVAKLLGGRPDDATRLRGGASS